MPEYPMELPGWWLLHPGLGLTGPDSCYGEAETLSRMYRPTPRVVRIMVLAVQREPEIPELEKEILDLSKRLGMGYIAGSNGPGMRMNEQSMRILCERLARLLSCALDLSAPRDKDADTSVPDEGFGDDLSRTVDRPSIRRSDFAARRGATDA